MNQRQIHDRVRELNVEAVRLRKQAYEGALENQAPERRRLQEECAAIGHIFITGDYALGRNYCPFCGQKQSGEVV